MLGLENLDTPFVENLSKALDIIHEVDSPWLHLYPDIGNLAAAGCHPPDELTLAKDQILGIHVKDAMPRSFAEYRLNRYRAFSRDFSGAGANRLLGAVGRRDLGTDAR
ncbi:MAG: TIM barrel protein [Ahniella sp.]|nr:TIM barrel protein [Ahniella sp.]